ncbi:MAG: GDSL-type esterase/lipase family protein [Planctomycetes bacterium]|nr:GDSL-type esterase/lipase family protein [Planctomycetota bacterium]
MAPGPLDGIRRRRRLLLLSPILLLGLLELVSRLYGSLFHGVGFLRPDLYVAFYPELRPFEERCVRNDDEAFDILLLGPSVLHPDWGFVQECLYEELLYRTGRVVWIHNLSQGGHTSLDSLLKYGRLGEERFDLVVVYHGINETRANNAPPSVFRRDYTHYSWYARLKCLEGHPESRLVTLPTTAAWCLSAAKEKLGLATVLPRDRPREDWVRYGSDVKTVEPFRENLTRILEIARLRGEPVLLMTFAFHIPEGYESGKFYRKELDYTRHDSPIELWGSPANVAAGIEAHNAVVRELAQRHGTHFVDEDRRVPKRGENFNDVCHLTFRGCERFVEGMAEVIVPLAGERVRR